MLLLGAFSNSLIMFLVGFRVLVVESELEASGVIPVVGYCFEYKLLPVHRVD